MRPIIHLSHGVSSRLCSTAPSNSAYPSTLLRAFHAVPCMRGSLHLRVPRPNSGGGVPGASRPQPHEEDRHMYVIIAPIQVQEGHIGSLYRGRGGGCPELREPRARMPPV